MKITSHLVRLLGTLATAMLLMLSVAGHALADAPLRIRIPVSRSEVVTAKDDVHTVAIADPRIADAAVGSARTVVVTAKSPGITSLVVYTQGGSYTLYEIESFVPNADRQVRLRVRVAEMTDEAQRELGFDWSGNGSSKSASLEGGLYTAKVASPSIPLGVGPSSDGILSYTNAARDLFLQSTWRALETAGAIHTLASPTLIARSGEKASFLAGGEIPVPIASAGGAGGAVTVTIEWKEFGVKVDFTPVVHEDSSLTLTVTPEVSRPDYSNPLTLAGFVVPSLVTRRASTTVNLRPGEHLVIGGLRQEDKLKTVKRVPLLGNIPLLGTFFTSTSVDNTVRELILVISPDMVVAQAVEPAELQHRSAGGR